MSNIILIVILIAGLSLLLYPTFSDYWNSIYQSRAIDSYESVVENLNEETYEEIKKEAIKYNQVLASKEQNFDLNEDEFNEYMKQLKIEGSDVIATIEIPKINCKLPIYHGTDDNILQVAIGHLTGSSLPIGGNDTHCVLTGHRGLPSAMLFSKLDQMEVGDFFILRILNEEITYEVDQILIVLPSDINELKIEEGKDLCTLITCTPYGVNSHRLLVRGHRSGNIETQQIRVSADAYEIEPIIIAPIFAAILLLLLAVWMLARTKKKRGDTYDKTRQNS